MMMILMMMRRRRRAQGAGMTQITTRARVDGSALRLLAQSESCRERVRCGLEVLLGAWLASPACPRMLPFGWRLLFFPYACVPCSARLHRSCLGVDTQSALLLPSCASRPIAKGGNVSRCPTPRSRQCSSPLAGPREREVQAAGTGDVAPGRPGRWGHWRGLGLWGSRQEGERDGCAVTTVDAMASGPLFGVRCEHP